MTSVLGLDIGGANTKAAYINSKNGYIVKSRNAIEYFPVWKKPEELETILSRISKAVSGSMKLNCIGITMTAELSDAYRTKREGVNQILTQVTNAFPDMQILILDVDSKLLSVTEARSAPLRVAASNWVATGWMVSQLVKNCIVIDVGSTSTSIIPIVEGYVSATGKTDLDKLMNGELLYTGSLRTNVAAIVNSMPIRDGVARVSSEMFAQSGDVHLVLGNITENEYTVETADGRGKTRAEALARLARVICADTEMLTEQEILQFTTYIYDRQIKQVAEGLKQVYNRIKSRTKMEIKAVVTGLGKNFIARKAAQLVGINEIIELNELMKSNVDTVTPAVGVALMAATEIEGRKVQWMQ